MGILKKLKQSAGVVSKDLLKDGLLGRGQITHAAKQPGISMGGGDSGSKSVLCKFTVQVVLDNVPPYEATCKLWVSPGEISQFESGGAVVAVRVNPDDHSEIAIDW